MNERKNERLATRCEERATSRCFQIEELRKPA